jgi:hypothetical protein
MREGRIVVERYKRVNGFAGPLVLQGGRRERLDLRCHTPLRPRIYTADRAMGRVYISVLRSLPTHVRTHSSFSGRRTYL